jgi:hypothetical protein
MFHLPLKTMQCGVLRHRSPAKCSGIATIPFNRHHASIQHDYFIMLDDVCSCMGGNAGLTVQTPVEVSAPNQCMGECGGSCLRHANKRPSRHGMQPGCIRPNRGRGRWHWIVGVIERPAIAPVDCSFIAICSPRHQPLVFLGRAGWCTNEGRSVCCVGWWNGHVAERAGVDRG